MKIRLWIKGTALALLTAALVVCSAGCGGRGDEPADAPASSAPTSTMPTEPPMPTAKELMAKAEEQMNAQHKLRVSFASTVKTEALDTTATIRFDGELAAIEDNTDMEVIGDFTLQAAGQSQPISFYYRDKTFYLRYMGEKIKYTITDTEQPSSNPLTEEDLEELKSLFAFDETILDNATVTRQGDGYSVSMQYTLPLLDKIMDLIKEAAQQQGVSLPEEEMETIPDIRFSPIEIQVSFYEDGNIAGIQTTGDATCDSKMPDINNPDNMVDYQIKIAVDVNMAFKAYGDAVVITPPNDLDTFVDIAQSQGPDINV